MIERHSLLKRGLKKFWASKSGGVLIYIAFALPILLGAMALSVDLGRAFILNTELKDFSDAAALAGAAELDGRIGAMAAAEAAARTGISNTLLNVQAFATDGGGPGITIPPPGSIPPGIVFLKNLPADGTDFTANDTAMSDAEARFIFVRVVNRNVRSGLSRALGIIPDFASTAKSIAGFSTVVCRVPAMFMCNPLEDPDFPIDGLGPDCVDSDLHPGAPLKDACLHGRGMLLKNGGGGGTTATKSQYFPGEFGLLSCPDGIVPHDNGIRCVAESIAQSAPNVCIASRAFPQTGQGAGPIRQAINTRFDIYKNPFYGGASIKNDPTYRAPLNVTKGYKPNAGNPCSEEADLTVPEAAPLPRDKCFYDGNCANGRYGIGDWYADGRGDDYWDRNHGDWGGVEPTLSDMTRYDMYRLEVDSQFFGETGPGIPQPGALPDHTLENGKSCNYNAPGADSSNPTYPEFSDPGLDADTSGLDEIDRRLLVLTAVNCIEHGPFQGAMPDGVPVEGYIQVFLTEPSTSGGPEQLKVWGELAGTIDAGTDGLRDIVQLYR